MKKDKELIEEIVERLKIQQDPPYKEGAWERFKKLEDASDVTLVSAMWTKVASVAACLLVAGFAGYFMIKKSVNDKINIFDNNIVSSSLDPKVKPIYDKKDRGGENNHQKLYELPILVDAEGGKRKIDKVDDDILLQLEYAKVNLDSSLVMESKLRQVSAPSKLNAIVYNLSPRKYADESSSNNLLNSNGFLANTSIINPIDEKVISPKTYNYGNKFSLGLFVAPNSTSDNLKIGAGLTVAYSINNRISIRTGASYNTYEVGVLKNPMSPASVETVSAPLIYDDPSTGFLQISSGQTFKMSLPNINAVSGFVESIEIPLEMKYNLSKSFYAAAGVSYSTIINQERNAQYVENIDMVTFKNGFPNSEKEAAQAMAVVTKTVKSSEKNVNTNGYNGFVNLSVGKKVKINSKFGVSIEPYFKIPVGEFRRSDMNYNNGGVRIMTTF